MTIQCETNNLPKTITHAAVGPDLPPQGQESSSQVIALHFFHFLKILTCPIIRLNRIKGSWADPRTSSLFLRCHAAYWLKRGCQSFPSVLHLSNYLTKTTAKCLLKYSNEKYQQLVNIMIQNLEKIAKC